MSAKEISRENYFEETKQNWNDYSSLYNSKAVKVTSRASICFVEYVVSKFVEKFDKEKKERDGGKWEGEQASFRVLDLCCGSGVPTDQIAEVVNALASEVQETTGREIETEVVGVDISEELIRLAKEEKADRIKNVKFVVSPAEDIEFPNNYFDIAVSNFGVSHVLLQSLLKKLKRIVKDGGSVAFSTWATPNEYFDNMRELRYKVIPTDLLPTPKLIDGETICGTMKFAKKSDIENYFSSEGIEVQVSTKNFKEQIPIGDFFDIALGGAWKKTVDLVDEEDVEKGKEEFLNAKGWIEEQVIEMEAVYHFCVFTVEK